MPATNPVQRKMPISPINEPAIRTSPSSNVLRESQKTEAFSCINENAQTPRERHRSVGSRIVEIINNLPTRRTREIGYRTSSADEKLLETPVAKQSYSKISGTEEKTVRKQSNGCRSEIRMCQTDGDRQPTEYQTAEPSRSSMRKNGIIHSYAACTDQGLVRKYNEDRVSIILNIVKPIHKQIENWPRCAYFGVYDGHGGSLCADFLRDNLHKYVICDENFPLNPRQALVNGFAKAESEFIDLAEKQIPIDKSGSCANVVLLIGDICYIANVGDSRAILSMNLGARTLDLSRDHKPCDSSEQDRILEAGGSVYRSKQTVKSDKNGGTKVVYGPMRTFPGRLSVSRAFGDIEAKQTKFNGKAGVIIAEPELKIFKVQKNHDFIFMGCDGIFDKMDSEHAVESAWRSIRETAQETGVTSHSLSTGAVENVIKSALNRRSTDNLTGLIISFVNMLPYAQSQIASAAVYAAPREVSASLDRSSHHTNTKKRRLSLQSVPVVATVPGMSRYSNKDVQYSHNNLVTQHFNPHKHIPNANELENQSQTDSRNIKEYRSDHLKNSRFNNIKENHYFYEKGNKKVNNIQNEKEISLILHNAKDTSTENIKENMQIKSNLIFNDCIKTERISQYFELKIRFLEQTMSEQSAQRYLKIQNPFTNLKVPIVSPRPSRQRSQNFNQICITPSNIHISSPQITQFAKK